MIVILITLLTTSSFAAGEPRAICPNPTIKAVEGENVNLPCYLDPRVSVVDYAMDWKREVGDRNKVVYSYRNKQEDRKLQMDQYRGRATVNHEDLRGGILTLQLSSVQLADSGTYRCFVSKLFTSCNVTLNVAKKGQENGKRNDSSTAGPPVDGLTEPVNHGAAKMDTVITIVTASLCGVVVGLAVLLFILEKLGKLQVLKMLKGKKGQEEEMMPDSFEMENLNKTTEVDNDPEKGLGQLVV